jgi:O-antigen ligase
VLPPIPAALVPSPIAPVPAAVSDGAVADRRSAVARLAQAARQECSGPYWAPAVLLCGGFLLDPAWTSHPAPAFRNLTIGRIVLLAAGVLLVGEAIRRRPRMRAPSLPTALLAGGLLAGVVVIGASAALHGTLRSQGSFAGYGEFVVIVLLVLALSILAPRFAFALLLATAAGTLISDALALSGLQGGQFGGARLVGAFGNANYLAFATGLSLSVMLGAQRFVAARMRIAILLVLPVTVAALVLTYSRSGLIGAGAGTVAALALMRPNVRDRLLIAAGATLVAVTAAVALYPTYQHLRLRSDFARQIAGGLPDRSGWDPSAQGFINGGSLLRNPSPGVLQVTSRRASTGVSYPLGIARRGGSYQLSLYLRAGQPDTPARIAMEDNSAANGPVRRVVSASPAWQRVTETWRPTSDSPDARLYVWATRPGAVLYLRDVALTSSVPTFAGLGSRSGDRAINTQLFGAPTASQAFSGDESNYVKSRSAAAQLSWKLFREHPLFGVGWQLYGRYAARELSPEINAGSPHDDYLRMAAELGIPGVLFLLTCIAALVIRVRRGGLSRSEQVAVAPLVAAGIGLLFITALETPSISLSLAAALGILCASPRPDARSATSQTALSRDR